MEDKEHQSYISIPESVTEVAYNVSAVASNVSQSVGDVVGSLSSGLLCLFISIYWN